MPCKTLMKTYVRTVPVRKLATIFGGESSQNVAGNIAGDRILSPAILPGCCRNVAGDNFLIAGDIAGRLVMTLYPYIRGYRIPGGSWDWRRPLAYDFPPSPPPLGRGPSAFFRWSK